MESNEDIKSILKPVLDLDIEQGSDFIPNKNTAEDTDTDSDDGYESYDSFYDNGIEIEFNPKHLVLLYHGRDEDTQSNKYKLIELSPSDSLCISDVTIKIPDSEKQNKDKIIINTLKKSNNKNHRYLYTHKHSCRYGVWNTKKSKFYLIIRHNCIKDNLIHFLQNHTVVSYNTPYQLNTYNDIRRVF